MSKSNKYILLVFILVLVLTGCAKSKPTNTSSVNRQNQNQVSAGSNSFFTNDNFRAASSTDLTIGSVVMVLGAQNDDGSVLAERIIIGASQAELDNIFQTMRPQNNTSTPNINTAGEMPAQNQNQNQVGPFPAGERPDFQNMSEEDRAKFREQMLANGGGGGGATLNRRVSARAGFGQNITGEILDKDETTLTLKLVDGGSKLIFYSDETTVQKYNQE